MRPITLWDSRAILAYFPKPAAEKLRYMIIRANELQTAGVADGNNGFFQAVDEIQVAISTELTDAGFTPSTLGAVNLFNSPSNSTELKELQSQVAEQEAELTEQDAEIEKLKEELESRDKALAKLNSAASTKTTKAKSTKKKGAK